VREAVSKPYLPVGFASRRELRRAIQIAEGSNVAQRKPASPFLLLLCLIPSGLFSQDLAPRAYVIVPVNSSAIILTYAYFNGSILFDRSIPITNATAQLDVSAISAYHTFNFFGRSASLTGTLPYGVGNFEGQVTGAPAPGSLYRSGLADASFRFSVNAVGGPAMSIPEFKKWKQKTIIGTSLTVIVKTGQYDPTKLVNLGSNRWAFKPEVGFSRRWGSWLLDAYGAVWFFTTNPEYFSNNIYSPGINTKKESPVESFEGHLSYDVRPRFWVSLDANFWTGGDTRINGVLNPATLQRSSRVGATVSIPFSRHQSVKISYNKGAYIRFGGDYQNVSLGWQYSWLGKSKSN
jgi:hypothetical protein